MKRIVILVIVSVAMFACIAQGAQSVDFKREHLSPKGRLAYNSLLKACIFRVGSVGYAGKTSKEELALYELLEERLAVEALKSLVNAGSYEGGLYGLLGLSVINNREFNMAVETYKARKERPDWQTSGSFECFRATGEAVYIQSGCIISSELREKVVGDIQSGRFDRLLTGKYRVLN